LTFKLITAYLVGLIAPSLVKFAMQGLLLIQLLEAMLKDTGNMFAPTPSDMGSIIKILLNSR